MLKEKISSQEILYCNSDFPVTLRSGLCTRSFREKFTLDIKYRKHDGASIFFFDGEGKTVGIDKRETISSLLQRLSARIEGLTIETFLKSTFFGSISLMKI